MIFWNDKVYIPGIVADAAFVIAQAIIRLGNSIYGYSERLLVKECRKMRLEGLHDFDLGTTTNLRNRIQRNWIGAHIWREGEAWGPKHGYASIFTRVKICPGETNWALAKGYAPLAPL